MYPHISLNLVMSIRGTNAWNTFLVHIKNCDKYPNQSYVVPHM